MANIVPKSEGYVTPDVYLQLRSELREVLTPLLDGVSPLEDGIPVGMALLDVIRQIRELDIPKDQKTKVIATAIGSLANEIAEDLVIVYSDEEAV